MPKSQDYKRSKLNGAFEFAPSDQSWIALQERIVGVTGKFIEDLSLEDERALRAVLAEAEMRALENYKTRKAYETARPNASWQNRKSELTLDDLAEFTNCVRALAIRIKGIQHHNEGAYSDVLEKVESDVRFMFSRYPGAEWDEWPREKTSSSANYLAFQIGNLPAIEESLDLLIDIYDLLVARENEIEARRPPAQLVTQPVQPEPVKPHPSDLRQPPTPNPGPIKRFFVRILHANANFGVEVRAESYKEAKEKAIKEFQAKFPKLTAKGYPQSITARKLD